MTLPDDHFASSPASNKFFSAWMTDYAAGEDTFNAASRALPGAKKDLAEARTRLDRIEGDIAANGGTPECPIDGSNAEKRKGQLSTALETSEAYVTARNVVREAEKLVDMCNGGMSEGRHTMERARLALEYAREWQGLTAAQARNRIPPKE